VNNLEPDPLVIESYRQDLITHGPTPAALGWTKEEKLAVRHRALTPWLDETYAFDALVHEDKTILDYGCGLGHLLVNTRADEVKYYTGVDVVPQLIEEAKRANARNGQGPIFKTIAGPQDITEDYDHIVACGVFTRMGSRSENDHIAHVRATLAALFARARVGLHVDFLDAMTCDRQDAGNLYVYPWDVLALARGMSPRVTLDCSYLPYEFAVHIYKDAQVDPERNAFRSGI